MTNISTQGTHSTGTGGEIAPINNEQPHSTELLAALPPEPPAPLFLPTLTTKELATRLRCSVRTVFSYREGGKIPALRINSRKYVYIWDQVVQALSKQ